MKYTYSGNAGRQHAGEYQQPQAVSKHYS